MYHFVFINSLSNNSSISSFWKSPNLGYNLYVRLNKQPHFYIFIGENKLEGRGTGGNRDATEEKPKIETVLQELEQFYKTAVIRLEGSGRLYNVQSYLVQT